MMIEVLKSKIHCARVTEANLNYMGSITISLIIIMANALKPILSKVNAVPAKFV